MSGPLDTEAESAVVPKAPEEGRADPSFTSGQPGLTAPAPRHPHLVTALWIIGAGLIMFLGLRRYGIDGSFWIDEASVAESLLDFEASELLGKLKYGISFPRWHLLFIKGLKEGFGYETWILRLPALVSFLIGTWLWVRLFVLRFRTIPLLIAIGVLLNFLPTTWFTYAAMMKQYTFDVLLALLVFSISDRSLDAILRRGERSWRVLLLALPCALSYTYIFALCGRLAGWYLVGARRGRVRLDPVAAGTGLVGFLVFNASIYWTDVRHTLTVKSLPQFWDRCLVGGEGRGMLSILDEMFFGWYDGRTIHNTSDGLDPSLMLLLRIFFVLGVLRIGFLFVRGRIADADGEGGVPGDGVALWGSRSLGALCCIVSLVAGAVILGYPLCASRLILFSLFAMQIVLLEGIESVYSLMLRLPRGAIAARLALFVLTAAILVSSVGEYRRHLASQPPENLRPLLARIDASRGLPLMVDACTVRQVRVLPEGHGDLPLNHYLRRGYTDVLDRIPYGEEAWVLNAVGFCPPFGDPAEVLRKRSIEWVPLFGESDTARLCRVKFGPRPEGPVQEKRR